MNIFSLANKISNPFKKEHAKVQPTTEELINRGFAPLNDKIDILFINPPDSIAERFGSPFMMWKVNCWKNYCQNFKSLNFQMN